MTEEVRHEIVQRRQSGMSLRAIAEELGLSRGAVYRALARVQEPYVPDIGHTLAGPHKLSQFAEHLYASEALNPSAGTPARAS